MENTNEKVVTKEDKIWVENKGNKGSRDREQSSEVKGPFIITTIKR
jgi:hypothetical protein